MGLTFCDYEILSASLGEDSPLPDIKNIDYIHAKMRVTQSAEKKVSSNFGKGMISTMLPYTIQNNYNRIKKTATFKAAILENDYLKAVFLPELGGRLWSLEDKTTGKELLYKNPVFQPGNLALRNAWFSGGVEWNVSIKGHNPLTCAPLFATEIFSGEEVGLRLYEYERIREITYSIDVWLPKDSKFLIVHPRIENTSNDDKYNYWWSNIAYPANKGVRVIVPADNSFVSAYIHGSYIMDYGTIPHYQSVDITYPENSVNSNDYFFDVPEKEGKWIVAVDTDGSGLLQCSTKELTGRKLFVWGTSNGGKNWNEFLSEKGSSYIEIQAGLAKTQLEHIPMKAGDVWEWTELYGAINVCPQDATSNDWAVAKGSVQNFLNKNIGEDLSSSIERIFAPYKNAQTKSIVQKGSGWGFIKNYENSLNGIKPVSAVCDFNIDSLGEVENDFYLLLSKNEFPCPSQSTPPKGFNVTKTACEHLEKYVLTNKNNWYAYLQLGVCHYYLGKTIEAEKDWNNSITAYPNAWAYRNLAMLYRNEYVKPQQACEYMYKAVQLLPTHRNLCQDLLETLVLAKEYDACVVAFDNLADNLKAIGRLQFYKAYSLTKLKRFEEAILIVNNNFVMDDIKEGEISISDLWIELYTQIATLKTGLTDKKALAKYVEEHYPLTSLDFRMHVKED